MRYQLCEADRAKYGGPEWLDIDDVIAWSADADYDALVSAEDQITALLGDSSKGLTWTVAQHLAETRTSTLIPMQRIRIWLCLVASGSDIKLADCKPKVLAGEINRPKAEVPDDDPPSSGEGYSTDTAEPSSPESATSTDGSTPGSPSTTA